MGDHTNQDDLTTAMALMQQQMQQLQQQMQQLQQTIQAQEQAAQQQQEQQAQTVPIGTRNLPCNIPTTRSAISAMNSASNGDFMTQTTDGAFELIENMAATSVNKNEESDFSKKGNKQPFAETVLGAEENREQSASSGATAPSEPAETLPVRVYVPKVPYPIPPKHMMDPISAEQLAGFRKMVRRLPQKISFEHAWEIRPLHMFFKNCRESQEEIKALFTEALKPSLKVLPKVDDPRKFVFPCSIAGVEFKEALCDSWSSVNLVSKAIVDELGIVDVEPSQVKLAFANSSMTVSYGTIRNLPVQVGDCVLHTEFQVVEMRNDHEMPLIFGRSFMATVGAIVDMPNKRVSFSNIKKKIFYKAVPT
ncbi:uncharacterized protein LOC106350326 [Brassica napus]|uniref:uncharacterized protein LOC106350326 n=1 Tax=Brassica napus TaxID=3708 RepID=UPI0020795995|nr:uncharacterized protein LOC106350326 [Brassica napus]